MCKTPRSSLEEEMEKARGEVREGKDEKAKKAGGRTGLQ
jgi:hypothetical protein